MLSNSLHCQGVILRTANIFQATGKVRPGNTPSLRRNRAPFLPSCNRTPWATNRLALWLWAYSLATSWGIYHLRRMVSLHKMCHEAILTYYGHKGCKQVSPDTFMQVAFAELLLGATKCPHKQPLKTLVTNTSYCLSCFLFELSIIPRRKAANTQCLAERFSSVNQTERLRNRLKNMGIRYRKQNSSQEV